MTADFHTKRINTPRAAYAIRQRGFSLIEVLISVVVLSVGVLGLAGLQIIGLKEGQTSYQRTQAILLAYEIADRMRANRMAAAEGEYLLAPSTIGTASAASCVSPALACTAEQVAAYDLQDWGRRVQAGLLNGKAQIVCVGGCGLGRRQTVTVMWDEERSGATGTSCSTVNDLTCFTVNVTP